MTPEMRQEEETHLLYVRRTGNYSVAAKEAWEALCAYAGPKGLFGPNTRFIGIGLDDPAVTPEEKLRYDACLSVDASVAGSGEVGVQVLAGGKYAVFLHKGPYQGLANTYQEIYGQWLPTSGETLREVPCFEAYLNDPDSTPSQDLKTEIFVPIE